MLELRPVGNRHTANRKYIVVIVVAVAAVNSPTAIFFLKHEKTTLYALQPESIHNRNPVDY